MGIVGPMAGDAGGLGLTVRPVLHMASRAIHICMCAAQYEIRQSVIEGRLVQPCYVLIASFMVGVAAGAFQSLGGWKLPMKPKVLHNIVTDILVAFDAQFVLWFV